MTRTAAIDDFRLSAVRVIGFVRRMLQLNQKGRATEMTVREALLERSFLQDVSFGLRMRQSTILKCDVPPKRYFELANLLYAPHVRRRNR
jgi:hypothetical protein